MKTLIAAAVAAAAFAATPAVAEDLYFALDNDTPLDLHYVYASPSSDDSWGEDLLGEGNVLGAQGSADVTIADGADACIYDFKFVMEDGSTYYQERVDVCSLGTLTIVQ